MISHDFILGPTDTDSVSVSKPDGSPFTEQERIDLLKELNDLMPEKIKLEDDGYFVKVIAAKSKNYVLYDGEKIKIRGSGLKVVLKELALKECTNRIINSLLELTPETPLEIYNSYVHEIHNVTQISRWTSKKTITDAVLNSDRSNESKIRGALDGVILQEGDKYRFYFKYDGESIEEKISPKTGKTTRTKKKNYSLKLEEHWANDHATEKLLEKLHKNVQIFKNVVDLSEMLDYTKKKNQEALCKLLETK